MTGQGNEDMAGIEKTVLTNMCMVADGAGNVIVQDRADADWPGVVFPGGHVEPGEPFTAAVIREVYEETGVTVENPRLCGVKQFPLDDGTRYVVLLYKADRFSGAVRSSAEGEARWAPLASLKTCRLAEGFDAMLRVFLDDELGEVCWDAEAADWKFL